MKTKSVLEANIFIENCFKVQHCYLQSLQAKHYRHQQINCNDAGCILVMELEFPTLMIDRHDSDPISVEKIDEAVCLPQMTQPIDANLISFPFHEILMKNQKISH